MTKAEAAAEVLAVIGHGSSEIVPHPPLCNAELPFAMPDSHGLEFLG